MIHEAFSCLQTSVGGKVAARVSTRDSHIRKSEVGTAAVTAKNIIIVRVTLHASRDILKHQARDIDAISRLAGWAAIQVVLLHIQSIIADIAQRNIAVRDIAHAARGVRIGLDADAILAVNHHRVRKRHAVHNIVRLAADGPNGQAVTAGAVHVADGYLRARGDGDAVVLVVHRDAVQRDVVARRDVKPVRVVRSCEPIRYGIWCVASSVVQHQVGHGQVIIACDVEQMCRPILDIQPAERSVVHFLNHNEVIRLYRAAVASQAIPVGLAVAINDRSGSTRHGDERAANLDGVEILIGSVAELRCTAEHNRGVVLQVIQIQCHIGGHDEVGQLDRGARGHG